VITGIELSYQLCLERAQFRRTSLRLLGLEKGKNTQKRADVKADEHTDPQQE
jgi:hypothetical protein